MSTQTRQKREQLIVQESDDNDVISISINKRIIKTMLSMSFALFFFVVIPVIVNLPYISEPWLNAGDVWKMIDPIFTVPLLYLPLYILFRQILGQSNEEFITTMAFMVSIAVYVEGHGLHTAATIFKDPLKYLMKNSPETRTQYPLIPQTYSYIRDDWEHIYSHYIYLVGAVAVSVIHMLAYRSVQHPPLCSRTDWALFITGTIFYGLMYAGIAVNFPSGLIVGFVWLAVYAVPWSVWLWRRRVGGKRLLFSKGQSLIPQFYLLSYLIGLVVIIIYICIFGFKDRASAGISLS